MISRILAALVGLASFAGVAKAADAVDPNSSTSIDIAKAIYEAFSGHHYAYAAALGLVLGVALVKRYLGPKVSWLHSDPGGVALTLLGAFGTAAAAGLASGGTDHVTWGLMKTSLLVAIGAAGGYSVLKKLVVEPLLKPLAARAPAWAQPIFGVVLWVFDKPTPIEDAEVAGDQAVQAKPSEGVDEIVGAPEEIN